MSDRLDLRWGDRSMVVVDGTAIHIERSVPRSPRPRRPHVAMLHGFASGTFTWGGIAPVLGDRWSLLAWDRPPFGRSDRPPPGRGRSDPYRPAAVLARSTGVLARALPPDHIAGSGVVLVGHSAGAVVAAQLAVVAARMADDVASPPVLPPIRGLVLIAPALDGAPPELVRRLVAMPGAGLVGAAVLRVAILGAEPALAAAGRHRTRLIEATGRETAKLLRRRGTAEALVHLTRTWSPPDVLGQLAAVSIPTLVIGGNEDRIVSVSVHHEVADALGGEAVLLPGVGHAAHEQVPGEVAARIGTFLQAL